MGKIIGFAFLAVIILILLIAGFLFGTKTGRKFLYQYAAKYIYQADNHQYQSYNYFQLFPTIILLRQVQTPDLIYYHDILVYEPLYHALKKSIL